MSRLNGNLEELIQKQNSNADEVIEVKMDGGNSW